MFKSISNNFGAPEITFRDVQTDRYVILNARFTFDPTGNETYQAAQELEIKVPDLSISKSIDAGVIAVYEDNYKHPYNGEIYRYHFPALLRSRIKDRNTICIEKVTSYDEFAPVHIYIYTIYSVLNTDELTELSQTTPLTLTSTPAISYLASYKSCIVSPDWVWLYIGFTDRISDIDEDITITLDGFPTDAPCDEFPIIGVNNQSHYASSGVHYASIREAVLRIPYATRNAGYSSADDPFLYLWLVRDKTSGQETADTSVTI